MKLVAPNNIFTTLFYLSLPEKSRPELIFKESSLVTKELLLNENSLAIIPSCDLINHRDLFVSNRYAIGFNGILSNSFLYYSKFDREFKTLLLKGDISSNEVILSKIIFKEVYNIQPGIELDVHDGFDERRNYLIAGNKNWQNDKYNIGISFAEMISEFFEYTYINYLIVSENKETIDKFHLQNPNLQNSVLEKLPILIEKIKLGDEISNFFLSNSDSIDYSFGRAHIEGFNQQIKHLFYYNIIDEIFDVKFV